VTEMTGLDARARALARAPGDVVTGYEPERGELVAAGPREVEVIAKLFESPEPIADSMTGTESSSLFRGCQSVVERVELRTSATENHRSPSAHCTGARRPAGARVRR
jgi:hypothetical protein